MQEKIVLNCALATSLSGLIILFAIASLASPEKIEITNLENAEIKEVIEINGVVTSAKDYGKIMFLELTQPQSVDVIVFKEKNISITKGEFVNIVGQIEDYNGEKEIVASSIEVYE